jgi:CDP-diacylglycerol---glycerol-3-phosphate 3-phosphatidyltransferase
MPIKQLQGFKNLKKIRISFLAFSVVSVFLVLLTYWLIRTFWESPLATRWVIVTSVALVLQLVVLWRELALNKKTAKSAILAQLGAGTWISLARVVGLSLMVGLLGLPLPTHPLTWLPFALCLVFNLSDFVDGYAARITNTVTLFGQKLDQDLDGRGLLVASLLAIQYGAAGWWFLLVGLARYFFVFGLWVRRHRGEKIYALLPNSGRRALAGTQMGVTTGMLAPILSPVVTVWASTLFMVPFLWNFYLDWLQVSGQTKLEKQLRRSQATVWNFIQSWLPLLLRTLVFCILVWQVFADLVPGPFLAYQFFLGALIVFGVAPRITSIAVLVETAMRLQLKPIHFSDGFVILCATSILFLGSGPFSLWQPEEKWVARRPGEKLAQ